jgi:hypothetical protein
MNDLRTAAQRLLDAIDRALPEAPLCSAFDVVADTADDLRKALAYREDKSQAAFEHWLVEKLLTVTHAQMAHADATCKQDLQVEPCNKSCAPGYCYCEPIIKPEIKGDNEPFGYFRAEPFGWTDCSPTDEGAIPLYTHPPRREWQSLSEEEMKDLWAAHGYKSAMCKPFARALENKLRAKNSTLACIPAVPPV